ncbi:MAG TPA: hypothetical protein VKY22_20230 [Bradyrhizobium sp.]|nr:hypothetical protein [Bradyrhizobium sp.]
MRPASSAVAAVRRGSVAANELAGGVLCGEKISRANKQKWNAYSFWRKGLFDDPSARQAAECCGRELAAFSILHVRTMNSHAIGHAADMEIQNATAHESVFRAAQTKRSQTNGAKRKTK